MKTLFKLIFGLLFLVFIILVVAGGYFGIIPGVSKLLGSDKPRDLGVQGTDADYASASAKGIQFVALQKDLVSKPAETRKITGSKAVSTSFTAQELTAVMNKKPTWIYNPVSDVQFKFNPDGTGEMSGILRIDRLTRYAQASGMSQHEVEKVLDYLKITNTNPPFYVKANIMIVDDKMNFDAQRVEVGRFPVPLSVIDNNKGRVVGFVEKRIAAVPGLSIKSLSIEQGQLQFEGTLPEVIASVSD